MVVGGGGRAGSRTKAPDEVAAPAAETEEPQGQAGLRAVVDAERSDEHIVIAKEFLQRHFKSVRSVKTC